MKGFSPVRLRICLSNSSDRESFSTEELVASKWPFPDMTSQMGLQMRGFDITLLASIIMAVVYPFLRRGFSFSPLLQLGHVHVILLVFIGRGWW